MRPEDQLRALGFSERDAQALAGHFADADRRGKTGHGFSRLEWLAGLDGLDAGAAPARVVAEEGFERWESRGTLGYLVLEAVVRAQLQSPPDHARVVIAAGAFPTGVLGHWVRRLAEGGLAAVLTAISPRRLPHPEGGPPLAGTNPLAIGIPSSDGRPVVADLSPAKATWGDVIAGLAPEEDVVPFGGEQAHKAFALAVGLQLLVEALAGDEQGAVLVVARPEADPVPALRTLAGGVRLPGDS